MYWAVWYLQHGFPVKDHYADIMKAYNIAKIASLTQSDFNKLVAAGSDPITELLNIPVTPSTPSTTTQTNALIGVGATALHGLGVPTRRTSTVASGLTSKLTTSPSTTPAGKTTNKTNKGSNLPFEAAGLIFIAITAIFYLKRNIIIDAITKSQGK